MENNFKVSKHRGSYVVYDSRNTETVCDIWYDQSTNDQSNIDANIICESMNLYEKTGLKPSQLHSQLEKAKELLSEYYNHLVEQDKATGLNLYSDKMKSRIYTFLEGSVNKTK